MTDDAEWPTVDVLRGPVRSIDLLSRELHAVTQREEHGVSKLVVEPVSDGQLDLAETGVRDRVSRRPVERYDHSLR